jgi:hypothetical protein
VRLPKDPEGIENQPDAPRFGRGFHKGMELWLKNRPVDVEALAKEFLLDEKRLASFLARAKQTIRTLFQERGWARRLRLIEQKMVYDPFRDTVRFLKSEGERDYSGRRPTEIPGTVDLALAPDKREPPVLIDWKTGVSVYDAGGNGQLKTLGAGLLKYFEGYDKIIVAIVRIDDEFMEMTEAVITREMIESHRAKLRRALRNTLSNNPSMTPGSHCKYCPALEVCPAQRDPLLVVDAMTDAIEPREVADVYVKLVNAEQLLHKIRDRIKRYVEMNGPLELDNGKTVRITQYEEESLSKASINRALGKVEGKLLIDKLQELGVIDKVPQKQLRQYNGPK